VRITALSLVLLGLLPEALGEEPREAVLLPGGLRLPCEVLGREGDHLLVRVGASTYRLEARSVAVEGGTGPTSGAGTFLDRAVARARRDVSLDAREEATFREAFAGLMARLRAGEDLAASRAAFASEASALLGSRRAEALEAWLGWTGVR
jgi:hypothetical protein